MDEVSKVSALGRRSLVKLSLVFASWASMHDVAVAQEFLPTREVAAKLADGKPWNGLGGPEGMKLTFNSDGTGKLDGQRAMDITWSVTGDDFCIKFKFPIGTKCMRFRQGASGFDSYEDGRLSVRFVR
jgi:hypothetical protein